MESNPSSDTDKPDYPSNADEELGFPLINPEDGYHFYQTFIDLCNTVPSSPGDMSEKIGELAETSDPVLSDFINSNDPNAPHSDDQIEEVSKEEKVRMLRSLDFRKFLIKEMGRTFDLVDLLSKSLHAGIVKPQRLLYDDENYYIGIDLMTNTYYVCYRNLLMIDIDYYKEGCVSRSVEDLTTIIKSYCSNHPKLLFRLYKSRGGIHGFVVSYEHHYRNQESIQLMLDLDCDFYYAIYSYLRGFSVRLNRKRMDTEAKIYEFIGYVGHGKEDEYLGKLTDLHMNLVPVFKDVLPSAMLGV